MINKHILHLSRIAGKESRNIIGLMSGTSLDGLDIALCNISGSGRNMKLELVHFATLPYDVFFKEEVKTIFSRELVDLRKLTLLNEWIGKTHASMINQQLDAWAIPKTDVDLIASHGQTIYHAPLSLHKDQTFGNGTLQIGDGDHIAVNTGLITISDFRQKHLAAGGEGAPLAAYGDYLLFAEPGVDVILLNIGGIANFTYLPAANEARIFSTDVGPGNTMMDALIQQQKTGEYYDKDAAVAKKGTVNDRLLAGLLDNEFLQQPLPKTTGPELFNLAYLQSAQLRSGATELGLEDIMATLNQFTARTIVQSIQPLLNSTTRSKIFISGGGIHNPLLIQSIQTQLPGVEIFTTAEKGINPDAKEAILFAILANETVAGDAESFPSGLDNFPAINMGKVSFPG